MQPEDLPYAVPPNAVSSNNTSGNLMLRNYKNTQGYLKKGTNNITANILLTRTVYAMFKIKLNISVHP